VNLDALARQIQQHLDAKAAAREKAIPAARGSIRASANAIRAIHRGEFGSATGLLDESRVALDDCLDAVAGQPDVRYAGYLLDAEKEYAEACLTLALVRGDELPGPVDVGISDAPYLNGLAETIGEGRRHVLDLLRAGEVERAEAILDVLEELFGVLVAMDYPDAITMNLRRSTDVARSLIEKTRGDLSIAFVQRDIHAALDEHARRLQGR
jgi:translin